MNPGAAGAFGVLLALGMRRFSGEAAQAQPAVDAQCVRPSVARSTASPDSTVPIASRARRYESVPAPSRDRVSCREPVHRWQRTLRSPAIQSVSSGIQ